MLVLSAPINISKLGKKNGRLLFEAVDERQTQPRQSVTDADYDKLRSWADIMGKKEASRDAKSVEWRANKPLLCENCS